jgi:O-antigen/teichoic acid export membrane protein
LNASTPQVAPIPSLGSVFGPLIAPSLFFAVQSYAVTFLMIQRGTVIDIAVYGAVTRFAQVFSILSSVNTAVLQPLVSRMSAGRNWTLVSAQIVGLTVAATALICLTAWALSNQLSWILGDKYLEYASLIPLAFVGTSCYFIGTIIYGILIARGITSGQWLTIPFGLFGMIAGYLLFEPRNAKDFLLFEAVRCSGYLLCQMTLLVYWIAQRRFQSVAV